MVKWWISLNLIFIISVLAWSWQKEFISMPISVAKSSSQLALLLMLINLNLFFVFLIIRKTKNRKVQKVLAKASRKAMKLHIPIAVSATALIVIHTTIMIIFHPLSMLTLKSISGLIAVAMLVILLLTGYRRHVKASGFRRKSHIFMAFTLLVAAAIHIFS